MNLSTPQQRHDHGQAVWFATRVAQHVKALRRRPLNRRQRETAWCRAISAAYWVNYFTTQRA